MSKSACVCVWICFMSHYNQIISIENLFQAWDGFKKEKRSKKDVQVFERFLEDNLFNLHFKLKTKTYRHSSYTAFNIYDPKFRHIHKAKVEDRVVHHLVVSVIDPIFDKTFIYDSYSCRKSKGMHIAVKRLFEFVRKVSKNYTGNCFALKLDIKKFFENIDHAILFDLIRRKVKDEDFLWLIENILQSFSKDKGIPIGNLTSQIFANIYLNELDQFVKHQLRIKYYLRYADDFIILDSDKELIYRYTSILANYLKNGLKLELHPQKITIRKYNQGIDFLGYIVLPHYILPRTRTKKRILKKLKDKIDNLRNAEITEGSFNQSLHSYLGFLKHANSNKLKEQLKNQIWMEV